MKNLYLVSISEGKSTDTNLLPIPTVTSDFTHDTDQNMSLVQPMLETMAISEVCEEESNNVPVINIFGNRENFRPLLYFKTYDVMLTTPKPFTYKYGKEVCLYGLVLMHLLCGIHKYSFHTNELRRTKTTGWADES